jgi:hypothetical protein
MNLATNNILVISAIGKGPGVEPTRPERGIIPEKFLAETVSAVNASVLKQNMAVFFKNLRDILSTDVEKIGAFEIKEVEISAQITADGQVALLGSGVKIEAQGGIKFVFHRTGK